MSRGVGHEGEHVAGDGLSAVAGLVVARIGPAFGAGVQPADGDPGVEEGRVVAGAEADRLGPCPLERGPGEVGTVVAELLALRPVARLLQLGRHVVH